ncbi:MAG TPA: hypothetical protein VFB79_19325 [Candidatus Angelobacter sp.]|nr:hypothetical protein [Candidatus Angelobacter sp.]
MSIKAPPVYKPTPPRLAAPPVFRPNQVSAASAQLKGASNSRLETRPAPPVYRPVHASTNATIAPRATSGNPRTSCGNPKTPTRGTVQQKAVPPNLQPVKVPIHPSKANAGIVQAMLQRGSGGSGDGGDGDKWKPWEPSGKLVMMPRTKGAGGKHFIPANWIDRLFAVVVQNCANLGQVENFISAVQDLIGEDQPLEISFYKYTSSESSPYVSLTSTSEKGLFQVIHAYKDKLREWAQNIYSHNRPSSQDRGGRQMDIPSSSGVGRRLQSAAERIVALFDQWLSPTAQIGLQDGDSKSWKELRGVILSGISALPDFEPKQYTDHGLKPGVYNARDLSQAQVVALINRAAEKDRRWAINLIAHYNGSGFMVYQRAQMENMRLGVMDNGDVWLVLRGG